MVNRDEDFNVLTSILNTYSEGSGSRINNQKTTGLWLGKWKKGMIVLVNGLMIKRKF